MNVQMYKLDCACPGCGRVPPIRYTEGEVRTKRGLPPGMAVATVICNRCSTLITLRAQAWQDARPDGVLPLSGPQPDAPVDPQLSPRQAAVCVLVSQGLSDRRIASRLGIGLPSVRKYLTAAAVRLRVNESGLPPTSPRRTIVAWYARRAVPGAAVDVFRRVA